jgi:crotonobetainyl-CoA:carnitine CoA-transferase CaiB-like acyl-CoA transferase
MSARIDLDVDHEFRQGAPGRSKASGLPDIQWVRMSPTTRRGPLDGLLVIDLSRVLSGPYCTMLLADMGARVVKVEQPGRGDETRAWGPPFLGGESAYFLSINRNKESLALNLRHPEAVRMVTALASRADVLVENFRPGTLDRLGLGHDKLTAANPRLITCSISGFGQDGPKRDRPGYDMVIQAEGGLMDITGPAEGSGYRLGVAVADILTGMLAAQGVLLALHARHDTGRGQKVDVAMLDSVAALLSYQAGLQFAGQAPHRMGNRHPTIAPYDSFQTSDGEMVLAVGNDEQWQRFCAAAGLAALAANGAYADNPGRVRQYDALRPAIADAMRLRTTVSWVEVLTDAGVPCGAVRSVGEVLKDPQLAAREMIAHVDHPTAGTIGQLGVPIKLSSTPGSVRTPPPRLGEHTEKILRDDLGLNDGDIRRLKEEGAI